VKRLRQGEESAGWSPYRWLLSGVLLALALTTGCHKAAPVPALKVDAERAWTQLTTIAAFGPRPSGSPAMKEQLAYLEAQVKAMGYTPERDSFTDETPSGPIEFHNLLARLKGQRPGFILLAAHYDTKRIDGVPDFIGANDGASGTALLLELMRTLKSQGTWAGPEIRFAFFDGEECQVEFGPKDGFHGSRHLAGAWKRSGELKDGLGMILLDMIGDADLKLTLSTEDSPELVRLVRQVAKQQGIGERVGFYGGEVWDDHTAFLEHGLPAVDLIDFDYGPNNSYWHTNQDTVEHCQAASLEMVGNLVLGMLANWSTKP
jgi:glutaminyl-peptide cyclotransferase